MFIIDDFLIWTAETLRDIAYKEITDESKLKEELLKLRTLYELDEISEEEYQKKEDEILRRLEAIREEKAQSLKK